MDARPPICLDLCCGLGGWTEGFLAAGYQVHGYDIDPIPAYPGILHVQDVRDTNVISREWRGRVDVIVASPPCQEFSVRDMPWGRRRQLPPPDMSIVNACFQLKDLLRPRVFLLENVRGAQPYIGRAPLHRGPFYFWGDVALLPHLDRTYEKGVKFGQRKASGNILTKAPYIQKQRLRGADPRERARIPWDLAWGFASLCRSSYQAPPEPPGP